MKRESADLVLEPTVSLYEDTLERVAYYEFVLKVVKFVQIIDLGVSVLSAASSLREFIDRYRVLTRKRCFAVAGDVSSSIEYSVTRRWHLRDKVESPVVVVEDRS